MKLLDLIKWDDAGRAALPVRVTPKASANRIRIEERDGENQRVRVDVTVAQEDGKANKHVISYWPRNCACQNRLLLSSMALPTGTKLSRFEKYECCGQPELFWADAQKNGLNRPVIYGVLSGPRLIEEKSKGN